MSSLKMNGRILTFPAVLFLLAIAVHSQQTAAVELPSRSLSSAKQSLAVTGFFYETSNGRNYLPAEMVAKAKKNGELSSAKMSDGRMISISIVPDGKNFNISLSATPSDGISKWGLAIDSLPEEFYTGLME